jgi:hypothetical protein
MLPDRYPDVFLKWNVKGILNEVSIYWLRLAGYC